MLGDGSQSKSYILVTDVVAAVLGGRRPRPTSRSPPFNVATGDYITVREIAELALEVLGLTPQTIEVRYGPRTAAGRATSRSSGSPPTGSAALGWEPERRLGRGAAALDARDARPTCAPERAA